MKTLGTRVKKEFAQDYPMNLRQNRQEHTSCAILRGGQVIDLSVPEKVP